jgi:hypothetical protein
MSLGAIPNSLENFPHKVKGKKGEMKNTTEINKSLVITSCIDYFLIKGL